MKEPRCRQASRPSHCMRTIAIDMENRIKEQQLALFADRTSCHPRGILVALAYVLHALRTWQETA